MEFVAIDVETANAFLGSICQIGAVRFRDGAEVEAISWLVDPADIFDGVNISVHGIADEMVAGQPTFDELHARLQAFVGGALLVCHTHFDRIALRQACGRYGLAQIDGQWLDSAKVARRTWPDVAQRGYGLAVLAARLGIEFRHHDALEDARAAALILLRAVEESGIALADWPGSIKRTIVPNGAASLRREGSGEGPLAGECIVFTGELAMTRRDASDRAASLGADVSASVTSRVTMLVVGDQDVRKLHGAEKSAKHRKAEALIVEGQPIRIVAECDFAAF